MSTFHTHPTLAAYESAPTLSMWFDSHQPADEMIWRDAFGAQAEWMPRMAAYGAHSEPRVISTHRSKSIDLPVPAILLGNPASEWAVMMVRDNFHDVNLGAVSNVPLTLDLGLVFTEMSRAKYASEKKRAQDSKMMGRITDAQWEDGSWYAEWSGGELIIDSGKIWLASRAFAEGISRVPGMTGEIYKPGCTSFLTVLRSSSVAEVVDHFGQIANAIKANLYP